MTENDTLDASPEPQAPESPQGPLFRFASPDMPLKWPKEWPMDVGLILEDRDGARPLPFHRGEDPRDALHRLDLVSGPEARLEPMDPDSGLFVFDEDLVEEAHDFLLNFEYARSEGRPLPAAAPPAPGPAPLDLSPPPVEAPAPPAAPPPLFPVMLPDLRVIRGGTVRFSATGMLCIDLPHFPGAEEAEMADIGILPGMTGLMVRTADWTGTPGTIILPVESARFLGSPATGDAVAVTLLKGWVAIHPEAAPAAAAPSSAQPLVASREPLTAASAAPLPAPRAQGGGSGRRLLILLAVLVAGMAAVAFSVDPAPPPAPGDSIDDLRGQLFEAPRS